jgi:subtilisin family serine protease
MRETSISPAASRVLVESSEPGTAGELTVDRATTRVLGSRSAGTWSIERLFPGEETSACFILTIGGAPQPSPQQLFDLTYRLLDEDGIRNAEPDLPVEAFADARPTTSSGAFGEAAPTVEDQSWARNAIRCDEAWKREPPQPAGRRFGEGIVVGHPDTGYTRHPAFGNNLEALNLVDDFDFIDNDDDARDPLRKGFLPLTRFPGHGTGTGSVIAGRDKTVMVGVAPAATLIPLRAVNSVIQFFDTDVARAVNAAHRAGCHVISMSLGGKGLFGLEEAIERAVRVGIIVLAAAGNQVGIVTAPASYRSVLAIGATIHDNTPWSGSSHGEKVLLCAPGGGIYRASWDLGKNPARSQVSVGSGTSFAVAHVAGAAALWLAYHGRDNLLEKFPGANLPELFKFMLSHHGHRVPNHWDAKQYGVGILDAELLLAADLPDPLEVEPTAAFAPVGTSNIDRVASIFTELDGAEVRNRLRSLQLENDDAERFAPEVLYHLLTDMKARENFIDPDHGATGAFAPSWRQRIAASASHTLEDRLSEPH